MRRRSFSTRNPSRGLLRWGSVGGLAALAALGLPGGVAQAATKVSLATIQVGSLSASATDVSYAVNFSSPAALTAGTSTITLVAPAGTTLSGVSCFDVGDDATGLAGCGSATVTGTTAVITTHVSVAAGDPVSVTFSGAGNPAAAGAKTLKVSTSADPTAASLHYTLAAKRAVTGASVAVSSASAGASGVAYSVTFASPDRLTSTSPVTIVFPSGTVLPAGGCSQVDWINDTNGTSGCVTLNASGVTATVTGLRSNPGDLNTITFYGVKSPGSAGSHSIKLSTSSDPLVATLTYSLVAQRSVTNPYLQLSSYTAGAANVTWSAGFTAPDRLVDSEVAQTSTTVNITAPAGTVFPAAGCGVYTIIVAGPAASQGPLNGCISATVTGSGNKVAIAAGLNTNPGNTVFVVINGVHNPSHMTSISLSTSADPATVPVTLTGPVAMTATDQVGSTSASATAVTYAETFASTGALTSGVSTLKLTSPGATFAPVCSGAGEYFVIDDTTGIDSGACPVTGSTSGPTMTVTADQNTNAGDEITVLARGVGNATSSGSKTFAVTSAAGGASLPFSLTAKTAVTPLALSLLSTSASASQVAYSATFTEPNGFMVSGLGDDFSAIKLTAGAGTTFPASGPARVINDATGDFADSSYAGSGTTATVLPGSGGNLGGGPGDEISVIFFGATNPSAGGAPSAALSTTSDPKAASAGYTLTAPTSVSDDILQLSSRAGGATGVTYSLTFQTANALSSLGEANSVITATLPAGTGLPAGGSGNVNVIDDTTGADCGGFATMTGTTAAVQLTTGSCPGALGAGDEITLVLANVTNPSSLAGTSVQVSTTSDPAPVTTPVP